MKPPRPTATPRRAWFRLPVPPAFPVFCMRCIFGLSIIHSSARGPPAPPSYWQQVNHHFFFVMYSFVAIGIAMVFEWDMFFPDLLDIFVLTTLPVANRRLFLARMAAIAIFVAGFLFDANALAPLVLPSAIDPPNLPRFLAGHLLAVTGSGLYAALFVLAWQGVLLSVLGERLFRKLSLLIQGLSIGALLMLLLLFPVLSNAVPEMLQSGSGYTFWFPPFWFLGIYQRLMEGPSALPVYNSLAQTGCVALLATAALAAVTYPIAYLRRVRQLVEGPGTRSTRRWVSLPLGKLLHGTLARHPVRRAVFHFISQSLLRVQRYRIYLVLYGGVGLSVVVATIVRLTVIHGQPRIEIGPDGLRASVGIVAFWTIAGVRTALFLPAISRAAGPFALSTADHRSSGPRWSYCLRPKSGCSFAGSLSPSLPAPYSVSLLRRSSWAGPQPPANCSLLPACACCSPTSFS